MYERFLKLLAEKGVKTSEVAKATKIHPSTFTDWKKGKSSPKYDKLEKIAEYFGVQVDYLTGKTEFRTKEEMFKPFDHKAEIDKLRKNVKNIVEVDFETVVIPVVGQVAAGQPIFAQEEYIDYEYIPKNWIKSGEFFGLQIRGDSMSPRIADGDTVIVRQQDDAESGDIVIVLVNGDTATCKRLMKYADGISLISFNPAYEPKTFTNEEIQTLPIQIIGKVVENRQKY